MVFICPYTPNVWRLRNMTTGLDRFADWIADVLLPAVRLRAPAAQSAAQTGIDGVRLDPATPAGIAPDDLVTVIDLKASPPAVLATVHAGKGASGVSFNPAGTLALVANRMEGTVSILTVKEKP